MFQHIQTQIKKYVLLTQDEQDFFATCFEYKKVPKKTMLLHEGDVCNFEAFVNKGCIRSYYIDEKGTEVVLQFAIENWWVSDIASFQDHTPSNIFIETLEECELLILSPQTKDNLLAKLPQLERMFRLMVQKNLSVLQKRFLKSITTSAEEKYLDFIERYPSIPQRVSQHYIASYLGISAEFLSKVRTRLAKK